MEDANQSSNVKSTENKSSGCFSSFAKFVIWVGICFALLWNWDGFWQTDIEFVNLVQQEFFSNKYAQEQLKIENYNDNIRLINAFKRLKDEAESERDLANEKLEKATRQCRYYDSSLRIIDILTKKYSEDELKRVLNCTSAECEDILHDRRRAEPFCN